MSKGIKYQIKIIEKAPNNERTNQGSMVPSRTNIKKTKETEEMKTSHTVFWHGPNEYWEEYHRHTISFIGLNFCHFRGHINMLEQWNLKLLTKLLVESFVKWNTYLIDDTSKAMNFIRIQTILSSSILI